MLGHQGAKIISRCSSIASRGSTGMMPVLRGEMPESKLNQIRIVIASEARQSRVKQRNTGLPRFARNDGAVYASGIIIGGAVLLSLKI